MLCRSCNYGGNVSFVFVFGLGMEGDFVRHVVVVMAEALMERGVGGVEENWKKVLVVWRAMNTIQYYCLVSLRHL